MKVKLGLYTDPDGTPSGFVLHYQEVENGPWKGYPMLIPAECESLARFLGRRLADEGLAPFDDPDIPAWVMAEYEGPGGA